MSIIKPVFESVIADTNLACVNFCQDLRLSAMKVALEFVAYPSIDLEPINESAMLSK